MTQTPERRTRSRWPAAWRRSRVRPSCWSRRSNTTLLATPADAYERAVAEAEERLAAFPREILGEAAFELRTFGGAPAPLVLTEFAERERADVIVLGSTHREGLGRVLPGSVGERLLHGGAPCAVIVAPSGFADREQLEIETIGVGYDGRSESRARPRGRQRARRRPGRVAGDDHGRGRRGRSGRDARRALARARPFGRRLARIRAGSPGPDRGGLGGADAQSRLPRADRAQVRRLRPRLWIPRCDHLRRAAPR